ncbi:hypothetical protein ACFQ64_19580 [Streptomyces sp. NPDC056460]|uniref:hypothetical protein n=1 Tax=Streptomyces sp. NPDC056460 TaxID=3345825 RepID=UPI0036914324
MPVRVWVEDELAQPWVTWFIGCATQVVQGVAITPHAASRDTVLAALDRSEPFGCSPTPAPTTA